MNEVPYVLSFSFSTSCLQQEDNSELCRAGPWSADLRASVASRLSCLEQRTDGALPQPSSTSQSCFPKGDEATAAAIAVKPNRALDSSPDASCKSPRGTLVEDLLVGGMGRFASRGSCQPSQILCHSQLCCVHPGSEVWECWPLASDLPHDSNSKKQCPKSACNDSSLIPTAWLVKRSESTNRNWPDKSDFFYLPT